MPSMVDVGPSGFSFSTRNDLDTTTFSRTRTMRVHGVSALRRRVGHAPQPAWQPGGAGRPHRSRSICPAVIPTVGEVVSPALLTGGACSGPFGAMPCSIRLTAGDHHPGDRPTPRPHRPRQRLHHPQRQRRRHRTCALDVWPVATSGPAYWLPLGVGVDLQIRVRVRLEAPPPGPVDVVVSAPAGSGVLFSASRDRGRVGVAGGRDRVHQHLLDFARRRLLRAGHDRG